MQERGRKTRGAEKEVMEPEKAPQQLRKGMALPRRIVEVREMRWHPD